MSILDGLSEDEIGASLRSAASTLSELINKWRAGALGENQDYVVTALQARDVARFFAHKYRPAAGLVELTVDDDLPLAHGTRLVDGYGRVFKGDGSAVDDDLTKAQVALVARVDESASDRIVNGQGFEHPPGSGKRFSLTLEAQTKWNGLYNARNSIAYPYVVPTKDDRQYHSIADAAEVETMYKAAVSTMTAELDAANAAKQGLLVAASTSKARAAADAYLRLAASPAELTVEP